MNMRLPFLMAALLIAAILTAGCAQQPAHVPETPAATPVPATTVTEATTLPVTTPVPTAAPEPFPGALAVNTPYTYGRDDTRTEVTIYRVKAVDGYEWWSPQWGRYYNTTPKTGNHFIFAFIRFIDRGTARARLPSPAMFSLHSDGNSYIETTDRDNSLPIKDISVKQYEYYYEDKAGWIDPAESNKVEGFILFEVPQSVTPSLAYLEGTFQNNASAVWKLG